MYEFYGKHVLAEFTSIAPSLISDTKGLIDVTKNLIKQSGASLVETKLYKFFPTGYTAFWVLKESHISIHTYPEFGAMFLDVFTCGRNINPFIIANGLSDYLNPQEKRIQMIERSVP